MTKRRRSSGTRTDGKASGLWQEPGSSKAFFDPSPRTNSAVVNGEGSPTLREVIHTTSDAVWLTDPNGGDSRLPRQRRKVELRPPLKTLPPSALQQARTFLLQQAQILLCPCESLGRKRLVYWSSSDVGRMQGRGKPSVRPVDHQPR